MDAVVFPSRTVLRFPNFVSFGRKPNFGLKEIADVHPLLNSSRGIRLSVSSIRADGRVGDPPPRRSSAPGRTRKNESSRKTKGDGNKAPEDQKPSNQEEIIALFKRIQTSIAKEKSASTKDEDFQKDKDGAESILEALRESREQSKGKTSKKAGDKVLRRKDVPKEQEMLHTSPAADFKLARPPSKFVKRSPIPTPSTSGVKPQGEASQAIAESKEMEFPSIEDMKLPELKAVAKSRGIKGYSKLKKNELLELLRS